MEPYWPLEDHVSLEGTCPLGACLEVNVPQERQADLGNVLTKDRKTPVVRQARLLAAMRSAHLERQ